MLLELKAIRKQYGGVTALRRGNLAVRAGEVHLLMGENGAGKSTLMKIVAGMVRRDSGEMLWRGQPASFKSPTEAAANGIAMVHQESLLAPHLSVAENIWLGREERLPFGWVNRGRAVEKARRVIEEHRFPLQPEWRVERLGPAARQMVEICRAISQGSTLLIFDEPTSSLSEAESVQVFRIVKDLRARNMGIIYITHRLQELRAIGDRVTILRDGDTVHSGPAGELSAEQMILHIAGREVPARSRREAAPPGRELLRVENLSRRGVLHHISFQLRAGEIVGMAGLIGAGRTELCRVLFGLDPPDSGEVFIDGRPQKIRSPRQAVRAGMALIPEDRQGNGLAMGLPVAHNLTLPSLDRISPYGFIHLGAERRLFAEYSARLHIHCESPRQRAGLLSGGNQQKVVIAKWLARGARVFLFDEPTRGIDVLARAEVFETMHELARAGAAILMVSSETAELPQVADRILVMRQGRISAELPGSAAQEQIMSYAFPDPGASQAGGAGQ